MTRNSWNLATVVAAVVLSTPATGLAQVQRVAPAELPVRRPPVVMRDQRQPRPSLSNQLRPFYRYELMHARTACGLAKEDLQQLRPECDAAYRRAIGWLEAARRGGQEPDYREVIREAVLSVVGRHVTPDRMNALRTDLRRREAARKEAAVDMLVAILDRRLLLADAQRRQIVDSLSAGWDDRWCDAVEAATGGSVVIPDVPDRLVTPFLSDAQRETWSHFARQWGRLWAANIDLGGDSVVDQDLGAGPPLRIELVAPPVLFKADLVIVLDDLRVREVVGRRLIVNLHEGGVEPAGGNEDDGADRADLLQRRQQALRERQRAALLMNFDGHIFGSEQSEEDVRRQLESALARRVDHLERACGLSAVETKKLQAAGRGDIKHFLDRVAEARRRLESIADGRSRAIADVCRPLVEERDALRNAAGPILAKSLARILADGGAASGKDASERLAFRHRAAVRWTAVLIARSLGMADDQRRRLESVLLEEVRLPRRYGAFDYWIVMDQVSRMPEARIRPILDDLQWRVLTQEFAAARQWRRQLEKGGFLPGEIGDDHQGPDLPAIHRPERFDTNIRF